MGLIFGRAVSKWANLFVFFCEGQFWLWGQGLKLGALDLAK
jgi:hypothetical protein